MSNRGQRAAYESTGNCVVLAGPGSGKTKTLTIKMARILNEDVRSPRGVACLTYNNECVRELKRRLEKLGVDERHNVFIGTVHSFCLNHVLLPFARLGGVALPEPLAVADSGKQAELLTQALVRLKAHRRVDYVRVEMDSYRRTHVDRADTTWQDDPFLAALVETYEELLRGEGYIDFDDMALIGLRLIEQHEWVRRVLHSRFPVLVVDEYQDLGMPLHRIVLQLCFNAVARLFAVGDPAQSVYGFAGAKPELLLELSQREDVQTVELDLNYRCGRTIVSGSLAVLGEEHDYRAAGEHEGVIHFHECPQGIDEQARYVCETIIPAALAGAEGRTLGDVAVLYNDYRDAAAITAAVKRANLKYVGGDKQVRYRSTPLTRWLEDCAAWCAGGWRDGTPRISSLIRYWLFLHRESRVQADEVIIRRKLVDFLMGHRRAEMPLQEWFGDLMLAGLSDVLAAHPIHKDEADSLREIREAITDADRLGEYDLASFGGLRGSKEHLNLVTLHS
nr:ATP-dependent helicase [Acidobacteriota bacterium]